MLSLKKLISKWLHLNEPPLRATLFIVLSYLNYLLEFQIIIIVIIIKFQVGLF